VRGASVSALLSAAVLAATAGGVSSHGAPPALAPAVKAHVQKVAVFGKDDRVPVPARYRQVKDGIGVLINQRTSSICTAFCVGDDLVATASHCMFRTAAEPLPRSQDVIFARDRENARTQSRIAGFDTGSATQNVIAGSMRLNIRPPIEASRDWAVIRLAEPVCRGHALRVEPLPEEKLEREAREGRVFQVAFHRDFENWRLAYSQPCTVRRDFETAHWRTIARDFLEPDKMILHLCDTGGASSGSPILLDSEHGPVVVGINVGTYVQSKVMVQNGEVVHRAKADAVANTAVNALAFREKLAAFASAAILPSGPSLKELQTRLKQRGFYTGSVDGTYGPALKAAIESYEAEEGLMMTGLASDGLLRRLDDGQYAGRPAPVETGSISARHRGEATSLRSGQRRAPQP